MLRLRPLLPAAAALSLSCNGGIFGGFDDDGTAGDLPPGWYTDGATESETEGDSEPRLTCCPI